MGVRIISCTASQVQAEPLTILDRAERSQRYLGTLIIVSADVGIHLGEGLFDRGGLWSDEVGGLRTRHRCAILWLSSTPPVKAADMISRAIF